MQTTYEIEIHQNKNKKTYEIESTVYKARGIKNWKCRLPIITKHACEKHLYFYRVRQLGQLSAIYSIVIPMW